VKDENGDLANSHSIFNRWKNYFSQLLNVHNVCGVKQLVKDENGDLANSHSILNRWKNYYSQLLNVHNVCGVKQIEVYTAEPLVPGLRRLEAEIGNAKLKKYKSPDSDEFPAVLIQAGGKILLSAIHKLINSVWNMEELPDQWKESIIVPVHKNSDITN
jgi:hypothetical protein